MGAPLTGLRIAILPRPMLARHNAVAMLYRNRGVLVNRSVVPAPPTLFARDLAQTPLKAAASIKVTGASSEVNLETVVRIESGETGL